MVPTHEVVEAVGVVLVMSRQIVLVRLHHRLHGWVYYTHHVMMIHVLLLLLLAGWEHDGLGPVHRQLIYLSGWHQGLKVLSGRA